MSEGQTPENKKINPGNLYILLAIPFYLIGVDIAITMVYYMTFAGAATKDQINKIMNYNSGISFPWTFLGFLLLLGLMSVWIYPIWKHKDLSVPEQKQLIINKLSYVYRTMLGFFTIAFIAGVASHLVAYRNVIIWPTFFKFNFPAMALSYSFQLSFTLIYLDTIVFGSADEFMKSLYNTEDLYKMREGYHISLVKKLILLLASASIGPMVFFYIFIYTSGVFSQDQKEIFSSLVINCSFVPIVLSATLLIGGIKKPVGEIISKMKKLSEGDFDVKSRIYFTDEIAQIKANFNVMVDQLKEREQLRETFGKFVSIEVARELMKSGKANLGGEEIVATVMFCDIRNFTSFSEKMSAPEVVEMLNSYFSFITLPISENHGIINKFIGDAVMAIFTPTLGSEKHERDAMAAALGMRSALAEFNRSDSRYENVRFGIGIHTGVLVAGNVGTNQRLEYTVIGDTVNIAARLESKTKDAGADILVSKSLYDSVASEFGESRFENVGPVSLKGKTAQIDIFKVK